MNNSNSVVAKCSTCHLGFASDAVLRQHFHSNIHDLNLKRKLLELPPLTLVQFEESFKDILKSATSSLPEKTKPRLKCQDCAKDFASEEKYKEHLGSKKHKENLRREKKEFKAPEHSPLDGTEVCLFCNFKSSSLVSNLLHMRVEHGFFIQDDDNCVAKEELLVGLASKVEKSKECIHCETGFKQLKDVQKHMLDSRHVLMSKALLSDFARLYDFTADNIMLATKYGIPIDQPTEEQQVAEAGAGVIAEASGEDEWEDVEESAPLPKIDLLKQKNYIRAKVAKMCRVNHMNELELPSGRVIGSRDYRVYYHQRYRNNFYERETILKRLHRLDHSTGAEQSHNQEIVRTGDLVQLRALCKTLMKEDRIKRRIAVQKIEDSCDRAMMRYNNIKGRQSTCKDSRHNRVLSKHYRDRNLCTYN